MQSHYIEKEFRAKIAHLFLFLSLVVIAGGLAYHQIIMHGYFLEQSNHNRRRPEAIKPKRGVIYDRKHQMIADNRLSFSVSVIPCDVVKGVTIPGVSRLLGVDSSEIKSKMTANFVSIYMPALVRRDQNIDVVSALEENAEAFPGVTYNVESVRRYVQGISAETFIGYIAEISPNEVDTVFPERGYLPGRLIGKKGIEKQYDEDLRGLEGTKYIERSAQGQTIGDYLGDDKIPAVPGSDLILTIDADLQRFIVSKFDSLDYCGAIVAIDPRNGEVIALASFPEFDPNLFSGIIPAETWEGIVADSNHPLLNRPITGIYPPGSTAKLFTGGVGLESGVITDQTLFRPCYGGMQFGNRFFKCWDPKGHGSVNIYHGIERSCDVYFYQLGQKIGVERWSEYALKCGFGKKTGIDIPGEMSGIVPSVSYYDRVYGKNKWSKLLVINLAIGQGEFTITPLQLAQYYCGLANKGIVYRPHLVKEIVRPDGKVKKIEPEISFRFPFSQETISILNQALELVVQGDGGTARSLRNKNYTISGKTGTAQNPHGRDHSWFVAYAPSEDPQIVVCGLVENAGHGSEVAAPMVGKIMAQFFNPKPLTEFVQKTDSSKVKP